MAKPRFAKLLPGETVIGTMHSAVGLLNMPVRILVFVRTLGNLETVREDVPIKTISSRKTFGRSRHQVGMRRMADRFDIWFDQATPHLPNEPS
jgi:hypothetical protein